MCDIVPYAAGTVDSRGTSTGKFSTGIFFWVSGIIEGVWATWVGILGWVG